MKKLFLSLVAAIVAATATYAEGTVATTPSDGEIDDTFLFTDEQGNVIPDGSVITVRNINEGGQMAVPVRVKNVSGEKAAVALFENIDFKPHGDWQTCVFGNCMALEATGYSPKNVVGSDYNSGISTEWIPESGNYATWSATLQIHVFNITTRMVFGNLVEQAGDEIIGYGPSITVKFVYSNSSNSCDDQVWWGYYQDGVPRSALGTSQAEVVNQAILIPKSNGVVAGNTIKGVRFYLRDLNYIDNFSLWLSTSLPNSASNANILKVDIPNSQLVGGDESDGNIGMLNEIDLPIPYTMGDNDVYVGYSYTVINAASSVGQYPVVLGKQDGPAGSLFLNTPSVGSWGSYESYGPLALQVLVEGDFKANAVSPADLGDVYTALGYTSVAKLAVNNIGKAGISSIDYVISADGVNGEEQHIELATPYTVFGGNTDIEIPVGGDIFSGTKQKTLTITKVNGEPNEADDVSAAMNVITLSKIVPHGIAVENWSGTGCGWCPRGLVGMEKMRQAFGDQFVGIDYHGYNNSDPMYISQANHTPQFSGAPSCDINRYYGTNIDPYHGTGNGIIDDIRDQLAIPAKAGLKVTGEWNEDSTAITATATIEGLVNGGEFTIEYMLIADSLTGTTAVWKQQNHYSQYAASELPDDLAFLATAESSYFTVFNDVCLATSVVNRKNKADAVGVVNEGELKTNSYTLNMPTKTPLKNAIIKDKVAVVALLISKDGTIANATKHYMKDVVLPDDVQMDNMVYIDDTDGFQGSQLTLSVKMKNSVEAEGFSFDMYLPDGVSVAMDDDGFPMVTLSNERTNSHKTNSFDAVIQADGSLRVLAASTNGSTISGNDGEVVKVVVNISEDLAPGEYPVVFRNIAISDVDAVSHRVDEVICHLIVNDYIQGDGNGDGIVDVSDFTAIAHYLLGRAPANFNVNAADANLDGIVDVGDLTAVAHLILYGSISRPTNARTQNYLDPQ